jgi:hypothetical protein
VNQPTDKSSLVTLLSEFERAVMDVTDAGLPQPVRSKMQVRLNELRTEILSIAPSAAPAGKHEEALLVAGDAFRATLIPRADLMREGHFPMWHGWALMDAFIAGAKFAGSAERRQLRPEEDYAHGCALEVLGRPRVMSTDRENVMAEGLRSLVHRLCAPASSGREQERPCTCHPDDNPPRPCPQKFALEECRKAAAPKQIIDPPGAAVETFRRRHGRLPNRVGDQLDLADRLELAAQACRAAHLLSCEATCREAASALSASRSIDAEAIAWALGKLEAFGLQTKTANALMMDRLRLMMLDRTDRAEA